MAFAVFKPTELDGLGLLLALTNHHDRDILADRRIGDNPRQVPHFFDLVAVEVDDHVSGLDASRLGRSLVVDPGDQGSVGLLHAEGFGDFVGHLLDPHSEPTATRLAELAQLVDDRGGGF